MSDSASWYQRKLAAVRSAPPGRALNAPVVPQRLQPQQYPQQQEFIQFQQQPAAPKVTIDNFWGAMQQWRGGKAHKIDAEPCPECGSNNYYSRTGEGARRGPPPAPHCFQCGYNGMFTQGQQSTWQGGG